MIKRGMVEPAHLDNLKACWSPYADSPQAAALESEADVIGYGGSAGGGKTDLLIGKALLQHHKAIIFRREYPQLKDIIGRSREIIGDGGTFNGQDNIWKLPGGRTLELGAVQYEESKNRYKGRAHDLKAFDEATEFSESQVRFLMAWNRTTIKGQRCQSLLTFNPPTTAEGQWVLKFFAPWLDRAHPNPAQPGELRWYAMVEGEEVERENGDTFTHNREEIQPRSRTFFPARLADNPALMATNYGQTLQNLPEPLRSQLLYGDFDAGIEDDPWQVIPTKWVDAAMARWKARSQPETRMSAMGVDPSRGGKDKFVIATRYDNWFAPLLKLKGVDVPDGPTGAGAVINAQRGDGPIFVDIIGIGSSVYDSLQAHDGLNVVPVNSSESTDLRDKSGKFRLVNVRTACWWRLREALDPETGDDIALPDDQELRADLTAPRFKPNMQGLQVESKHGPNSISERLGRSPDCGDALAYLFAPEPVITGWNNDVMRALAARHAGK